MGVDRGAPGVLRRSQGKRPTLRLVIGINYKEGVSQSALAEWYAISRTTVNNWLSRLGRIADEPFEDMILDD